MSEQREFTRISRELTVVIDLPGRSLTGHTQDVSVCGVLITCDQAFDVGVQCTCALLLEGDETQPRVRATATIIRKVPGGMALRFDEILDPESFEHLRQLVRFNARDVEKVERENEQHLGLKRLDS